MPFWGWGSYFSYHQKVEVVENSQVDDKVSFVPATSEEDNEFHGEGLARETMQQNIPNSFRQAYGGSRNSRFYGVVNGLRVMQEDAGSKSESPSCSSTASPWSVFSRCYDNSASTIFQVSCPVVGRAEDICLMIMDTHATPLWDGSVEQVRVVAEVDPHTHILHIKLTPPAPNRVWRLWPFWSRPRDLVVERRWRREEDGSCIVLYQSTTFPDCPPRSTHVRAHLHGAGYTIAPRKSEAKERLRPSPLSSTTSAPAQDNRKADANSHTTYASASTPKEDGGPKEDANSHSSSSATTTPAPTTPTTAAASAHSQPTSCLDPQTQAPMSLLTYVLHVNLKLCWLSVIWHRLRGINLIEDLLMSVIGIRDGMLGQQFLSAHLADAYFMESERPSLDRGAGSDQMLSSRIQQSQSASMSAPSPRTRLSTPSYFPKLGNFDSKYWSRPDVSMIKVRGKNYIEDRKKIFADEPAFELVGVDCFEMEVPQENIAGRQESLARKLSTSVPFMFIIQLMVPGPPHLSMVMYFVPTPRSPVRGDGTPFSLLLSKFLDTDDAMRSEHFKLIPHVREGSWIVKQTVGNTPTILGKKLKQTYHTGPNYMEVDVDISSSSLASAVIGVCIPVAKSLVVDVMFLLEGHASDQLPEKILGAIQFNNVDLKACTTWLEAESS